MKQHLLLYILCSAVLPAQAQLTTTYGGGNLNNPAYSSVKGNAYLPMLFSKSYCIRVSGGTDTVLARLNTHTQLLEVKNPKLPTYSNAQGVYRQCQIQIEDEGTVLFQAGFPAVGALTNETWFRVVYGGKTKLLKHTANKIKEDCYEYGGIHQPCFKEIETYYL